VTTTAVVQEAPTQVMQGIMVPASAVNPEAFFAHTRRLTFPMGATNRAYAGLGNTDQAILTQTGIIAQLSIKLSGTLTVTPGTGTVATTSLWPLGMIRSLRVTANGQSNLVNAGSLWLRAREMMARGNLVDRGVQQFVGGASPGTPRQQGTLSLSNEAWGVGSNVTGVPAGSYAVEEHFVVPIAFDERTLLGAVFAQTASTELTCFMDWANQSDLFTTTGAATVGLAMNYTVEGIVYSIPEVGGQIIVPNLSTFHSFIVSRVTNVANGDQEPMLSGQGVGRQLLRIGFRVLNGPAPGTPLPMNAVNFGQVGWRYGGNDTPEVFTDGKHLAWWNERTFGTDFGSLYGIGVLDFCNDFVLRDSIDEGLATNLRLLFNLQNAVPLSGPPVAEVMQETMFGAAAGG